ncbi:MAG: serine O-acetyltransferase [Candidatus Heimdallarchaeota archaeon]|nr:serine O-acetyltransferase [Candidatus Heimdallarchaeota archaeon]
MLQDLDQLVRLHASDIQAAYERDPAAKSILEVLTSYPGVKAILLHRIAHFFEKLDIPYIPRFLSDISRTITGIEIHPGATIGSGFFIDHGSGTVIGETAEIGNNVTLYQGVTLGGVSLEPVKRHPTLEDNVMVGSNASVLGDIRIGKNTKIGANSVVVKDVPENSTIVGVLGRTVKQNGQKVEKEPKDKDELIHQLLRRIESLENQHNRDITDGQNQFKGKEMI